MWTFLGAAAAADADGGNNANNANNEEVKKGNEDAVMSDAKDNEAKEMPISTGEKILTIEATTKVDFSNDILINLVVCYQHLGRGLDAIGPVLEESKSGFVDNPFLQSLARVEGAFDRETGKYKVAT